MRKTSDVGLIAAIVGLGVLAGIALYVGLTLLGALILKWAWGLVVPALFHGPKLTYLQALGIVLLLNIVRGMFTFTVNRTGDKS